MTCQCCSGPTKRFGRFKNRNRIVQRYRCCKCGVTFSEGQPLDGVRVETAKAVQVVTLLAEGLGVRAISRITQLDQGTVLNVLETVGRHCAALLDTRVRNVKVEQVQIDEVFSFVNCLQASTSIDDQERGDQYLFLAMERNTKCILHWHVGKRNTDNAVEFIRGLKGRLTQDRFQLTSDGFAGYIGFRGAMFQTFRHQIDYGTEVKLFAANSARTVGKGKRREFPVVCQWIKRTPRIGNPVMRNLTVNHAERNNLSVRLFNKRFARKTICYSKTLENHKHSVALLVAHFNFCRVHSAIKATPAQAQGLTDHVWSVEELITATI